LSKNHKSRTTNAFIRLIKEQRDRDFLRVYSLLHWKFHKWKSFPPNSAYFTSCFTAREHCRPSEYFPNAPFHGFMRHMLMAHVLPDPCVWIAYNSSESVCAIEQVWLSTDTDSKSCFFKIICDWRLLLFFRWNLVGNVSGLALHTMMTSMKQTRAKLCFCFLDNLTYRQFPTLSSYSCALNYIIYRIFWWLIRIVVIALETFKRLWLTDRVLSQWPFDRKVDCLKSLANRSNAWSLSIWTHKLTDV